MIRGGARLWPNLDSSPCPFCFVFVLTKTKTKTKQKGQGEESRFGPSELSNHLKNKGYIALNLIP